MKSGPMSLWGPRAAESRSPSAGRGMNVSVGSSITYTLRDGAQMSMPTPEGRAGRRGSGSTPGGLAL